jgi:hypothetical protein
MEWVAGILGKVKWLLVAVVALIALAIIFHREISESFTRITRFTSIRGKRRLRSSSGNGSSTNNEAVRDGCLVNRSPIPPTLGVKEAARRLGDAKGLSPDLVQLIAVASNSANALFEVVGSSG